MKIIKYLFEFILIIFLFFLFKIIGKNFSSDVSCKIASYIGPYFRSKERIHSNIEKAFPKISMGDKKKYINEMWCNFGRTFSEYVYLKNFRNSPEEHIKVNGSQILDQIKLNNKPTIFISGHFANFELMAMELDRRNLNIAAIYRPLNNIFLNPLMEYWRKKYICKFQIPKKIPGKKGDGTKEFLKAVQKNTNIAVMVDQSITQGKKINFFNELAYTTSIPAQLVLKYGYQIVPVSIQRVNKYYFTMNIHAPIVTDKSTDTEITIGEKINKTIEKIIITNPGQWIWTHNRWKV